MEPTTVVYLYCVVKSVRRPMAHRVPSGLPGGTTPEVISLARGQWLVTSDVPLDVYGPGRLDDRLRDLEWVAEIAVAHESVVEHFARVKGATAVPLKLFTMFSSRERAIDDLAGRRTALNTVMRRVAGCEEWGIRVTRSSPAPVLGRGARTEKAASPNSGTAFLAARRDARDAARAARESAAGAAEGAYSRLTRLARDSRLRDRPPEGGTNPPILEAAFLVPVTGRARFKAEAKRQAAACTAAGADMTLTGPWPAYSFVSLEALS